MHYAEVSFVITSGLFFSSAIDHIADKLLDGGQTEQYFSQDAIISDAVGTTRRADENFTLAELTRALKKVQTKSCPWTR